MVDNYNILYIGCMIIFKKYEILLKKNPFSRFISLN